MEVWLGRGGWEEDAHLALQGLCPAVGEKSLHMSDNGRRERGQGEGLQHKEGVVICIGNAHTRNLV